MADCLGGVIFVGRRCCLHAVEQSMRCGVVLLLMVFAACDGRACLAQSDLFAGFRPDLIEQCCTCLSQRGTRFPGSSCAEATLQDDGTISYPDGAVVAPADDAFSSDDGDNEVSDDEIPCLCTGDFGTCTESLSGGGQIDIAGGCLDQPGIGFNAPCEAECGGVLTYEPLST